MSGEKATADSGQCRRQCTDQIRNETSGDPVDGFCDLLLLPVGDHDLGGRGGEELGEGVGRPQGRLDQDGGRRHDDGGSGGTERLSNYQKEEEENSGLSKYGWVV